jgi:CrcB protein
VSARRSGATDLVVVSAGGAAGALLRLAIDTAAPDALFPWPTLAINVVGAFVLGLLPALGVVRRSRTVALALGPGVLGGFTTVSAWAGQVRGLADDGHTGLAGLCLLLTLAAGLAAAALGRHLAGRVEPPRTSA